jgi:hypothetical protein
MASGKVLNPSEYSDEERTVLIDFVLALRKSQIQEFLTDVDLPKSGTKEELRERLQEALDNGSITYEQLVGLLDFVAPWGKQHVFIYHGPRHDIQSWKNPDHISQLLKQHRLGRLFNARLPLVLPEKLTLSSVMHGNGKLRITAVQRREYTERTPEHDDHGETTNGERITLRAYVHHVTRTLVAFEWDLNANVAMVQITQLQMEGDYEKVAEQISRLIHPWLDLNHFAMVDLRPVISGLQDLEGSGKAEARSHGIQYRSPRGRSIAARSPTPRDSVLGEAFIDDAINSARKNGIGHLGNFYWLHKEGRSAAASNGDTHVIIVGAKSRINFPTPNTEDAVRYVLNGVRALSPHISRIVGKRPSIVA